MPQVNKNKLKSLCQICVDCISESLNKSCEKGTSKQPNVVDPEINNNSFELLPIVKLEEIIKILSNKGRIKKHVLQVLIVPQLRHLDVSWLETDVYFDENISCLLNLASLKCQHLKKLCLRSHQISRNFITYIPTFVELHVLDISYSAVDDLCLQMLGASCRELKELNISYCRGVTDLGIQGLCGHLDHLGRKNDRLCQSICKLSTPGTQITRQGIQFALSNLPSLKVWNEVSVQLLYNIHYTDFFIKNLEDIPKYSLINICVNNCNHDPLYTPYICESLNLVVSICPYIMQVEIEAVEGLKDSDLFSLLSLQRLSELHISGSIGTNTIVTFNDGIAPVLKGIGSSLKTLSLSRLHGINILIIIENCPSLRSLTLEFNKNYVEAKRTKEDQKRIKLELVLGHLEKLRLSSSKFHFSPHIIPQENLISLLLMPSLRNISIHNCMTLTDNIFKEATDLHHFRHLEYLELCGCHNVTDTSIELLMNNDNVLKEIVLHSCKQLMHFDIDFWRSVFYENNWLVSIDYKKFESDDELFRVNSSVHSDSQSESEGYYD